MKRLFLLSWPDGPFFFYQQKKQNCQLKIFVFKSAMWLGMEIPKNLLGWGLVERRNSALDFRDVSTTIIS
ncbi:hypothetical protein ASE92_07070 [Pedobacter sp. Leaf41]|jgi:hypothetical protein|nr:hypothetical protein ASE92_07070 [Pedobacter sp. Leaf41]